MLDGLFSILTSVFYWLFEWLGSPIWWLINQALALIPSGFTFDTSLVSSYWPIINAWVPLDLAFQLGGVYTGLKISLAVLRFLKSLIIGKG